MMLVALLVSVLSLQMPQASTGTSFYELGARFAVDTPGKVTAIRYFRWQDDPGPHVGRLWSASGAKLAEAQFTAESASGWQEQALPMPVAVLPGAVLTVTVNTTSGSHYPILPSGFSTPLVDGHLTYRAGAYVSQSGLYPTFESTGNYFRGVAFQADPIVVIGSASDVLNAFGSVSLEGFASGSTVTVSVTVTDGTSTATASGPLTIPGESPK